jgi:hypothetical protein
MLPPRDHVPCHRCPIPLPPFLPAKIQIPFPSPAIQGRLLPLVAAAELFWPVADPPAHASGDTFDPVADCAIFPSETSGGVTPPSNQASSANQSSHVDLQLACIKPMEK